MTPNKKLLLAAGAAGLAGLGFGYLAHDNIKQHVGYAGYLLPHKYYVYKAAREMDVPILQALGHDLSKFYPDEWSAYSGWFNGPKGQYGTKDPKEFAHWRKGVAKHYARNEHHWRPKHLAPNEVPLDVKLESIADWYGVQRTRGFTNKKFKDWFEAKKSTFPIDKPTVEEAERRILKNAENKVNIIYAQYLSRNDDGKRKYTWIAHDTEEGFKKAKQHVIENGYREEGPVHKMTKEAERRLFKTAFMPLGLGKDLKTTAKTVSKAITNAAPATAIKENPIPKNFMQNIKPVDLGFPKLAKQKPLSELFITTEKPLTGHELPVSAFTHERNKYVYTANDGGTESRHNVAGGLMGTEKISTLRKVFKVPSIKTFTKAPEETAAGDKEVTTTFIGESSGTGGTGSSK
jgi:hypothetical protein